MSESPEDKFRTLDDPDSRPTVPVELVVGEPGWQLIIPARAESLAAFLDVGIVGMAMEKTVITARELCALSGITPRRLRWWIERGVIKARIVKHRCLLNQRQALAALIVCELRISGFRLDQIRRLKLLPARADYLVLLDGRVHWSGHSTLIRRLERAPSGCHVVDVRELRELLQRRKSDCNAVSPPVRRSRAIAA